MCVLFTAVPYRDAPSSPLPCGDAVAVLACVNGEPTDVRRLRSTASGDRRGRLVGMDGVAWHGPSAGAVAKPHECRVVRAHAWELSAAAG